MTGYLVQPREFTQKLKKNLSSKYSQKLHDHAKESTADALKTASKRAIEKTPEETGNLMDSKIADALVSRMTVKLQKS